MTVLTNVILYSINSLEKYAPSNAWKSENGRIKATILNSVVLYINTIVQPDKS